MSQCEACVLALWILYHATFSCKGSILVKASDMCTYYFFVTPSAREIPKVILGYADDYSRNTTTIQCIITEAVIPYSYSERVMLLKDGALLRTLSSLLSNITLSLDIVPAERTNGNFTCVLEVILRGVKKFNVSTGVFTRTKGKLFHSVLKLSVKHFESFETSGSQPHEETG